jgi:hypothetical protein
MLFMKKGYASFRQFDKGRVVGATYNPKTHNVVLYFSRRLTPDLMGAHRSVSELNQATGSNFVLSRNRRSLVSTVTISVDAATALKKSLGDILPSAKLDKFISNVVQSVYSLTETEYSLD